MTNGTPASEPPAQGAGGSNRTVWIIVAVLVLAGVAVGAYFIGRAAADADAAEERGVEDGREQVASQFERGESGYERIFQAGYRAGQAAGRRTGEVQGAERGRRLGIDQGREIGQLQGEREGIQSGATAALGGLTDWEPGAWYVVKFGTGEQGVPFRVQSRQQMSQNLRYAICADNPADICTEPIAGG
jgi:hypothetical protein